MADQLDNAMRAEELGIGVTLGCRPVGETGGRCPMMTPAAGDDSAPIHTSARDESAADFDSGHFNRHSKLTSDEVHEAVSRCGKSQSKEVLL